MNILFINHYSITPSKGGSTRHFEIGKRLIKLGHNASLIGGAYHHHLRKNEIIYSQKEKENIGGMEIIWLKLPYYKNPHSIQRFLNWFIFAFKLLFIQKRDIRKPEIIFYSSTSLLGIVSAYFLSKRFKARLVLEIRDIWPLTVIHLRGLSKLNPLVIFLRLIEIFGYFVSEIIFTTMPLGRKHIIDSGFKNKKVFHLPNGIENKRSKMIDSDVSRKLHEIQKGKFVVGYAGSIGSANWVESLILAAKLLKNEKEIFFSIIGDGPKKKELVNLSKEFNLNNIFFGDRVPREYVPKILSSFSVCFHGSGKNPLYDFGVSPNKMAEYMLHGKPIIDSYSGARGAVEKFNCGITVPAGDHKEIAKAIIKMKNLDQRSFEKLSENAKSAIDSFYDYDVITLSLEKHLKDLYN